MHRSVYDWDGEQARRQNRQRLIVRAVIALALICATLWIAVELVNDI